MCRSPNLQTAMSLLGPPLALREKLGKVFSFYLVGLRQLLQWRGKRGGHHDTAWRGWLDGTQNGLPAVSCASGVIGGLTVTGASPASPPGASFEAVQNLQHEQFLRTGPEVTVG